MVAVETGREMNQTTSQCQHCKPGKLSPVHSDTTHLMCDWCWAIWTLDGELVTLHQKHRYTVTNCAHCDGTGRRSLSITNEHSAGSKTITTTPIW